MKRPQFFLADMLWTVGLLSLAIIGASVPWRLNPSDLTPSHLATAGILLYLSPVLLGAAVAAPFRRKAVGAVIGIFFSCAWLIVLWFITPKIR